MAAEQLDNEQKNQDTYASKLAGARESAAAFTWRNILGNNNNNNNNSIIVVKPLCMNQLMLLTVTLWQAVIVKLSPRKGTSLACPLSDGISPIVQK